MTTYKAPLTDMQFLLKDVMQATELFASMPATAEVSDDLVDAILEEAGKLCEGLLAPINQTGDQQGCRFDSGIVTTPDGFKEAFKAYAEGGWVGLTGAVEYGGMGMPKMLSALIEEMAFAANSSFALYPILSTGAALCLKLHGSEELKKTYLPKIYAGTWSGSMCLTEPHAGTDLGIIKSKAEAQADGSYSVTGTKIFITAGEHDLNENIIHLVLAKLPDSPPGPRGISLFLVPKFKVDANGEITDQRNAMSCGSIEHKMGIRASATCVLNFDAAQGYLVGELNQGLACMFTMMNYERLSMGLQGNGLADSSYQVAAEYAKDRVQGRAAGGPVDPDRSADPIIVHPDVRRMLLTMRANIMAGRALTLYTASKLDIAHFHSDSTEQERAQKLVTLLIPIVKAYCTDRGFDACVAGQQVLGGHGYIAEWGLEQNVRDARIAQIYEGTNGVQALDLMGRKTVRSNGELMHMLFVEISEFLAEQETQQDSNQGQSQILASYIETFKAVRRAVAEVTSGVLRRSIDNPNEIGAASYAYLELMGLLLYSFMWLRILVATQTPQARERYSDDYLSGLRLTGDFFFARLLPKYKSLVDEIDAGADSLMAMPAEQF